MRAIALAMFLSGSLAMAGPAAALQLPVPAGWRWLPDGPAQVSAVTDKITDSTIGFARMPPGFHVTTGPGVVLYEPRYFAERNYVVETEIFHFPNSGAEEYGLFVGGRELEGSRPRYLAFVVRKDGSVAAWEQVGSARRMLAEWRRVEAVAPNDGKEVVRNLLRLAVTPKEAVLRVNRLDALILPLEGVSVDGAFGFRVGRGVNLHASRLDVTHRLAPARGE